jgi:5-methylthioribose kinase
MALRTKAEAVIPGDLHTGSITISDQDTGIIRAAFAFFGPVSFDVRTLPANLALG